MICSYCDWCRNSTAADVCDFCFRCESYRTDQKLGKLPPPWTPTQHWIFNTVTGQLIT